VAGSMPTWAPLSIPGRDVSPGSHRDQSHGRTYAPYGDPANRAEVQHSPGSMPEGVLVWAQKTVTWPVAPPRIHRQGSNLGG
jgi:hypothetical protein